MITVYGIKNCDTVKKALKWLADHNIEHKLHDYRVDGVDLNFLTQAEAQFGVIWMNKLKILLIKRPHFPCWRKIQP